LYIEILYEAFTAAKIKAKVAEGGISNNEKKYIRKHYFTFAITGVSDK